MKKAKSEDEKRKVEKYHFPFLCLKKIMFLTKKLLLFKLSSNDGFLDGKSLRRFFRQTIRSYKY